VLLLQVIAPDTIKVVRGKGMPISKSPGQFGDLRIKFKVCPAAALALLSPWRCLSVGAPVFVYAVPPGRGSTAAGCAAYLAPVSSANLL